MTVERAVSNTATDQLVAFVGSTASQPPGVVVVRPPVFAAIADIDVQLGTELWTCAAEGGLDAMLDLLARDGVRQVPAFAMVESCAGGWRVVVRGSGSVSLGQAEDDLTYTGAGVGTWAEHKVAFVSQIALGIDAASPDSPADPETVLAAGVCRATAIVIAPLKPPAEVDPAPSTPTSARVTTGRTDDVVETAESPPAEPLAEVEPPSAPEPAAEQPEVDVVTVEPSGVASVNDALDTDSAGPELETPATDLEDGEPDVYAEMFGATVARTVIDAAVHEAEDEPALGADPSTTSGDVVGAESESVSSPPSDLSGQTLSGVEYERQQAAGSLAAADGTPAQLAPSTNDAASQPLGDHDGHTMSLAELRRQRASAPSTPTANAEPGSGALGDHDGHTMSLAELRRMKQQAPTASPNESTVNAVQSARCFQSHDNPPQLVKCRICDAPLDGATVTIPRPTLGTLRFSTGQEAVLDRAVVVGRKPDISGQRYAELPRELTIAAGDGLSRSHAAFIVEGWQVRVEDLGSTNHTTVTLPGREPQRLRGGEPMILTNGALIDLGGEVTCTYDAIG